MNNYINVFSNDFIESDFKDYFKLINQNHLYKFPTTLNEFKNINHGLTIIKNIYKTFELKNISPKIIILPFEDDLKEYINDNYDIHKFYNLYLGLVVSKIKNIVLIFNDPTIHPKIIEKYHMYTIEI